MVFNETKYTIIIDKDNKYKKRYVCNICCKTFTHPENLNLHYNDLHNKKNLTCFLCF